ncbi:uncharacterized protein M421DRAFT_7895 [Didymella exigua CBS 183.55]|uniref:Uncharacterized protein n=1 Tax=Didymella exigua CBS 183.55 TaxID=1150837 RepID=A0A6A5RAZ9_9PLEO|nr:uncharacterized protein M421DRAFT_7895 [Didymella exigua CBS 183.55]KAF1925415.1 hypothetical protein M421DRAFT_7895 [Didymella exigua CBS 183.55]
MVVRRPRNHRSSPPASEAGYVPGMMAFSRGTRILVLPKLEVFLIPTDTTGNGGIREATAPTFPIFESGLEDLAAVSTTIAGLTLGPRNAREAVLATTLALAPLREIRGAPELLTGFADEFKDFELLFRRIVKERGSVREALGAGFAFAAVLEDLMVARANAGQVTVWPVDSA